MLLPRIRQNPSSTARAAKPAAVLVAQGPISNWKVWLDRHGGGKVLQSWIARGGERSSNPLNLRHWARSTDPAARGSGHRRPRLASSRSLREGWLPGGRL